MRKPPSLDGIDPTGALRAYARAHDGKVRTALYGSANLPGGGRVAARVMMDGRPVKMFAGPLAVELETQTRSAAPFSLNQPDRIYGNQRASGGLDAPTVHASDERGFVVAQAWLGAPDVRAHVQSIASLDAAYGLHVLERQVFVVAAAVQLDLLVPALVALAVSLEALTEPETPREGTLPASLAPLMRFEKFAVSDDLDRSELFETRADDVQRVAREVEPFVGEIAEYLEGRVWTREMHCLSDLLELVREARLCRPVEE